MGGGGRNEIKRTFYNRITWDIRGTTIVYRRGNYRRFVGSRILFMNDIFRFIGDTENGLGYIHGQIYMLELQGRGSYGRVMITAPITCPYDNWNKFFENWERV